MIRRISQALVAALWAGAISATVISVTWGRRLQRDSTELFLGAAPLIGRDVRDGWDWRFGWGLVGAGAVAVLLVVAVFVGWFERARLRTIVVVTSAAAGAFAILLALTDGADGVLYGAEHRTEYLWNLGIAPPAGEFVRTYVENIRDYSVHARGHPPGFILLLKLMDAIGLSGRWPAAMLSLVSTTMVPALVLVTVWAVAGPMWVRRSAPFLVVAPYALWMMTSADAFYSALGASGVALLALGLRRVRAGAWLLGAAGGLMLATLLFMTYGGALYMLLPATVVVTGLFSRRPGTLRVVAGAVIAAVVVTVAWWAAGFWWFAGAAATREEYWNGTAQFRIWNYFIFANLVAGLIAVGPATFVGFTRLKDRRVWILVGGALIAIAVADLSQLSKAEVERIWVLFYPWLVLAGAGLASVKFGAREVPQPRSVSAQALADRVDGSPDVPRPAGHRRHLSWACWIGLQAACAIVLQAALVSKW